MIHNLYTPYHTVPTLSKLYDRNEIMLDEAMYFSTFLKLPIFPVSSVPGNKKPLVSGGFKAATADPEIIKQWFSTMYRGAMIGLPTGQTTGLLVVDVDMKNGKDGLKSLRQWEESFGILPETLTVKTPTGGYHLIFKLPEGINIPCGVSVLGEGIDIRADGGYVVALGSINEAWESYSIDCDLPLAPAPDFLIAYLTAKQSKKEPAVMKGEIPEGHRNNSLFRLLCSWYSLGVTSKEQLELIAMNANSILCKPPLSDSEVFRIVESIFKYDPAYSFDSMGNAERFSDRFSNIVKCINGEWLIYKDGVYTVDIRNQSHELAKQIAKELEAEAKHAPNAPESTLGDDISKTLNKLAKTTKNNPLAMLSLAASDPKIAADFSDFDKEPHLLNCKNCVLDLDQIKGSAHNPSYLFTKQLNASYLPDIKSDLWLEFLRYITEDDQELCDFLARLYGGVGLYGGNPEQVMAILFGHGKNGKSIFADTIRYVMGSYSDVIRQEVLMASSMQNVRHDVADIRGARYLLASEPPPGSKLNGSVIKELTGGDMIKGRHIYQNSVTFQCEGLISLVTNWEPEIETGDAALKRRLLFIRLNRIIPEEQRDPLLGAKLQLEADGILTWLVKGRADYLKNGLQIPDRVVRETKAFNTDMDYLEHFFASECTLEPALKGQADELYNAYHRYMFSQNENRNLLGKKKFFMLLARRFQNTKINGLSYYKGLALKTGH